MNIFWGVKIFWTFLGGHKDTKFDCFVFLFFVVVFLGGGGGGYFYAF